MITGLRPYTIMGSYGHYEKDAKTFAGLFFITNPCFFFSFHFYNRKSEKQNVQQKNNANPKNKTKKKKNGELIM